MATIQKFRAPRWALLSGAALIAVIGVGACGDPDAKTETQSGEVTTTTTAPAATTTSRAKATSTTTTTVGTVIPIEVPSGGFGDGKQDPSVVSVGDMTSQECAEYSAQQQASNKGWKVTWKLVGSDCRVTMAPPG